MTNLKQRMSEIVGQASIVSQWMKSLAGTTVLLDAVPDSGPLGMLYDVQQRAAASNVAFLSVLLDPLMSDQLDSVMSCVRSDGRFDQGMLGELRASGNQIVKAMDDVSEAEADVVQYVTDHEAELVNAINQSPLSTDILRRLLTNLLRP